MYGLLGGLGQAMSQQDYERRMHEQRMMNAMQQQAFQGMNQAQCIPPQAAVREDPAPKKPVYLNRKFLLIRRRK